MAFTYLLPIVNITAGITPRVELVTGSGASLAFADSASAKLATAIGGSYYFLYTDQWPSASLPFTVKVSNHSTGSLLGMTAFNNYDVQTSVGGAGASETTIVVNDASDEPIQGVEVWLTRDSAGENIVAGTISTDAFGSVTFYLDPGIYYVWKQKPLYSFVNPTSITVT